MRKISKLSVLALFLVSGIAFFMPCASITASANSAQAYWEGVDSMGAVVMDTHCPIEVQHEKLVFDIPQFPHSYYKNVEDFAEYNASVSATYTFYNPADYTVKASLAFPFGRVPYYVPYVYDEERGEHGYYSDTDKYDITVDGVKIEKDIRFTLSGSYGMFDITKCLPYLGNDFIKDEFYSLDLPVTKYTYEVSGITNEKQEGYATFDFQCDPVKTRVWIANNNGYKALDDGCSVGMSVVNHENIDIYVLGEPLSYMSNWTIYENRSEENKIEGAVTENEAMRKSITFEEFAFSHYFGEFSEQEMISSIDWYNSVVYSLNEFQQEYGLIQYHAIFGDFINSFMRWYQYDIEIPAKGTIVNTVTAPIYPSIDEYWEPPIYAFTYLLSPAKTWSKFGKLDVEIHTPYYLINDEMGFTKTETGYALSLDGLPNGELTFKMSTDANAKRITLMSRCMSGCAYSIPGVGCGSIIGGCAVYSPIGLSAILLLFKKRK